MSKYNENILNAIITRTHFGFEDHGMLHFDICFDYGGSHQCMGGIIVGGNRWDDTCDTGFFPEFCRQLFLAVGVDSWEELVGTHVRVERDMNSSFNSPLRVGHILKDQWVDRKEIAAIYFPKED